MSYSISPVWNGQQFFDNNGLPLAGGKIYQYQANSFSIQQSTYTDNTGLFANLNPIILDSAGRVPVTLFLSTNLVYNLVLTDSNDNVLQNVDNVSGVLLTVNGMVPGSTAVWQLVTPAPAFVNSTSFTVTGDYTVEFAVGNRVQIGYSNNTFSYGSVNAVAYNGTITQVTLTNDSTVLNSGLTSVSWSAGTVAAPIVDAGAVTWELPTTYTNPITLGYKINSLSSSITGFQTLVNQTYLVLQASGAPSYLISADPNITSYTIGQKFTVQFVAGNSGGTSTLSVNGLTALPLLEYTSSGALQNPKIVAGMVGSVAYDGTNFILITPLPPTISNTVIGNYSVQYLNISFTYGQSYTIPANCIGIYVYASVNGSGNSGARVGLNLNDASSNLVAQFPIHGTNELSGPDGGSGMADSGASYVPIDPSKIANVSWVLLEGNPSSSYTLNIYAAVLLT